MDSFKRRKFLYDLGELLGDRTAGVKLFRYAGARALVAHAGRIVEVPEARVGMDWAREVAPGVFRRLERV